jgi:hypothetical protein
VHLAVKGEGFFVSIEIGLRSIGLLAFEWIAEIALWRVIGLLRIIERLDCFALSRDWIPFERLAVIGFLAARGDRIAFDRIAFDRIAFD